MATLWCLQGRHSGSVPSIKIKFTVFAELLFGKDVFARRKWIPV